MVWIGTQRLGAGYRAVLNLTDDVAIPLVGDVADRYANAVLVMVSRAVHDAAVFNQWVHGRLKVPPQVAYKIIKEGLEPDRPPVDADIPEPLRLGPGIRISEETGRARGVLYLHSPAELVDTAMDAGEAHQHALHVLQMRACADLDTAYAAYLAGAHDQTVAAFMVHELQLWLDDGSPEPTSRRLARDLTEAGAPPEIVSDALASRYDDYKSELAAPCGQLVADLRAAGREDLASRAIGGEWDGSKADADEWAASPQGQAIFAELLCGAKAAAKQPPTTKPRPAHSRGTKRRRRR